MNWKLYFYNVEVKCGFKDLAAEVLSAPRLLTMQDQMIIIGWNRLFLLFIAMCLHHSVEQWAENDSRLGISYMVGSANDRVRQLNESLCRLADCTSMLSSLREDKSDPGVVPESNYNSRDGSVFNQYHCRKPHCCVLRDVLWFSSVACLFDCNIYLSESYCLWNNLPVNPHTYTHTRCETLWSCAKAF